MFKHLAISLAVSLALLSAALAAPPAKHELSVGGEFVNAEDAHSVWSANMNLLIPLGSGHLKLGPDVTVGSLDEANRIGARLELNVFGDATVTPFVGAGWGYFQKDVDGLDRDVTNAFGGLKFRIGNGGFVKPYVIYTVDGRGSDSTDVGGGATCVILF